MQQGMVYNIQRMSTEDGPGMRTTVFLKGCPLRCLWCSNPESQTFQPQLLVFEDICSGCGHCAQVCPEGAVTNDGDKYNRDTALCTNCGLCVEGCPSKARVMSGSVMTVEEVMKVIRKDSLFYQNSEGGGVTFGGGEPTAGGEFLLELLRTCQGEGFHTCLDTCGFCPEERFRQAVGLSDLLLFDCKHMDPAEHKRLTGQDNTLILTNLRYALRSPAQVRIRMPLMPGMNDSEENIAAMGAFFAEFGVKDLDVLPCHAFGRNKYTALRLPSPPVRQYAPDELKLVLQRFERHGLKAHIA